MKFMEMAMFQSKMLRTGKPKDTHLFVGTHQAFHDWCRDREWSSSWAAWIDPRGDGQRLYGVYKAYIHYGYGSESTSYRVQMRLRMIIDLNLEASNNYLMIGKI